MFLSNLSIKRPVLTGVIIVGLLFFGLLAYTSLPLNLMPAIEMGVVTVQTVYPGAGPREIEMQVTKKIEDAVSTISGIDYMQSYSMESVSIIVIFFELDVDADIANQEVKDKTAAILNELPEDAQRPVIEKLDFGTEPIMDITLTGDLDLKELREIADKTLKDRLSQIEGVARVEIVGGAEREIRVEFDNRVVFQNSLSLSQLAQILAMHNMNMPGGQFEQHDQEYSVRFQGEFSSLQDLEALDVPTPYGNKKLGQLATVRDTGSDVRERTIYFDLEGNERNDRVVLLQIVPAPDGNTVEITRSVRKALPVIESALPAGSQLTIVNDDSVFIEDTVADTMMNVILGIVLTGLVLLFFLHDLRSTLIVALAMPISIFSSFTLIKAVGFTQNVMTLMGLSTSVGILVTNSVVVLENIFRHKQMGHNRIESADRGTSEIAIAVIASTLTNVVVFVPIAMMSGIIGIVLRELALTVTFATLFSLLVSLTVTPMLASLILPESDKKKHPLGKRLEAMFASWERVYKKILAGIFARKIRGVLVVVAVFLVFICSLFIATTVGFEFFPELDEGSVTIEVELPQGYTLNETAGMIEQIENRFSGRDEVVHILTTLGSLSSLDRGTNMAKMNVQLVDSDARELSSRQLASQFIRDLSDIPNAKIRVSAISGAGMSSSPIEFYLQGQDNDMLEVYKEELLGKISNTEGLVNLTTSSRTGKPEITLIPDRIRIAEAGLSVYELAFTLRSAVEGVVATTYRELGNEYDIRVLLQDESVDTPEEIGNIAVASPNGMYRLAHFADVDFTEGYSTILHRDKFRTILFSGGNAPGYPLGNVVAEIQKGIDSMDLPPGYEVIWGGDAEMMQESMFEMLRAFAIAVLLLYMLLAAVLENLVQPILILITIPLALIGVFFSLFLAGITMNIMSMMAIIMLIGIVVNAAILLLDYTNILRKQGMDTRTALTEACPTKLKPIIMSTLAIILGMMPMALGIGSSGAEMRQPLGIVSIGGLIVSAILTLIVIPTLYNLFARDRGKSQAAQTNTGK
jgi:HAE1 family hydrophobic/amphiphilic exporter-1